MVNINLNLNPGNVSNLRQYNRRHPLTNANPTSSHWGSLLGSQQPARLVLSADTPDFDPTIIDHFKEEGFTIGYLAYDGDVKKYQNQVLGVADRLEMGEKFAIVAYGEAATICLDTCMKPTSKLTALIAYYPTSLPKASAEYPPSLAVQIHLAGTQNKLPRSDSPNFSPLVHHYPSSSPGFAEHDLDTFSKTSSRLSWSRTLSTLHHTFGLRPDLERIWDNHTYLEFSARSASETMKTMVPSPYVNHIPTMTGGIGSKDLHRFYADYFIPSNPPDTAMTLLSRTVGSDRVVDEMRFRFTHTVEVPWMFPGIPPTGKEVDLALVAVVCIRGGKLYHEHIYWDQASALVQIGLIDPKLVPEGFKTSEEGRKKEVKRLPVVGAEGVRKVVDEEDGESNELIPGW